MKFFHGCAAAEKMAAGKTCSYDMSSQPLFVHLLPQPPGEAAEHFGFLTLRRGEGFTQDIKEKFFFVCRKGDGLFLQLLIQVEKRTHSLIFRMCLQVHPQRMREARSSRRPWSEVSGRISMWSCSCRTSRREALDHHLQGLKLIFTSGGRSARS